MAVVTQPVLPLIPTEATPIGPIAALVDKPGEGGVVYVNGLATFCFDADDELGRRLAAVQLVETEIARPWQVASGFAVTRTRYGGGGVGSLPRGWRGWCRANAARPGRSS